MLDAARRPPAPHMRPRYRDAEVRWSDRTWHRVTIIAWHRLEEPYQSIMSVPEDQLAGPPALQGRH
jgi:hypothetical protein